jgi:hypothetical protein
MIRTETEIKERISFIQSRIDELHKEREDCIREYHGMTEENEEDFMYDIAYNSHEIKILEWVLGIRENKNI